MKFSEETKKNHSHTCTNTFITTNMTGTECMFGCRFCWCTSWLCVHVHVQTLNFKLDANAMCAPWMLYNNFWIHVIFLPLARSRFSNEQKKIVILPRFAAGWWIPVPMLLIASHIFHTHSLSKRKPYKLFLFIPLLLLRYTQHYSSNDDDDDDGGGNVRISMKTASYYYWCIFMHEELSLLYISNLLLGIIIEMGTWCPSVLSWNILFCEYSVILAFSGYFLVFLNYLQKCTMC